MSGSHYAPEPPADGPIYQADTERLAARQWQRGSGDERTQYDLRTVTEREADALAQLELRLENLLDVVERHARRIRALEVENTALRADLDRHAETVRLTTGPVDVALDVAALTDRVTALETKNAALWEATDRHADLLQHYRLTAGI